MKSAEEWLKHQTDVLSKEMDSIDTESQQMDFVVKFYKQIQLDAYKAGMSEAAALVEAQSRTCVVYSNIRGCIAQCESVILSARDAKKTIWS